MNPALARMRLDPLLHFHVVARQGSLRRAAELLSLTPSAVTRSLQRLEEDLGQVLARRTRSGFELTEAGARLLRAADRIVMELDGFLATPGPPERWAGLVSLGISPHAAPGIDAALDAMLARFPECRLSCSFASPERLVRSLAAGEIDLGVGLIDARAAGLRHFTLTREPFRYYISRRHPLWSQRRIRRADLSGHAVAWMDDETLSRAQLEARVFRAAPGQLMRVGAFSNDFAIGLRLALRGRFVVPLARSFAADPVRRGELRELRIRPRVHELVVVCAWDGTREPTPPLAFLLETMKSAARRRR